MYYVRPKDKEARSNLIRFLEEHGYSCVKEPDLTRDSTLESIYPVIVYKGNKTYSHIRTTTSAACACSAGRVISDEEFYSLF